MVVALAIGAVVVMVAVIAYGAILRNGLPGVRNEDVHVTPGVLLNFYGLNSSLISVSRAPNFTAAAAAEDLRNRFHEDVSSAVAVFCLGRNGLNTVHPTNLYISDTNDVRTWTGPANFKALLTNNSDDFTTNTNYAIKGSNLSIYILGPSTNLGRALNTTTNLVVRAIYDADLVTNTTPPGVYASVRRYVGSTNTAFYHVFYASDTTTVTNTFWPLAYYYPKGTVNGVTNTRPFYLVWWPDPASAWLPPTAPTNSDTRSSYTNMGGQSSFSFVVPVFPEL
jgi:hypothetical protein